ncbi:hypothetical protein GALMADRAFT_412862 [Galerina marginata CBS 339.88]|uniref:Uncharacterized protein n=1 Tax=Galerina marginata (strain CBS 339.88) TaxID=685588 RepID=A0A067T3Q2_GALM3|nr:hypothetical protein GALMADRAFT_412862 [Galerina marginata CBS 339.88]
MPEWSNVQRLIHPSSDSSRLSNGPLCRLFRENFPHPCRQPLFQPRLRREPVLSRPPVIPKLSFLFQLSFSPSTVRTLSSWYFQHRLKRCGRPYLRLNIRTLLLVRKWSRNPPLKALVFPKPRPAPPSTRQVTRKYWGFDKVTSKLDIHVLLPLQVWKPRNDQRNSKGPNFFSYFKLDCKRCRADQLLAGTRRSYSWRDYLC